MNKKAIYSLLFLISILWPIVSLAACPDPDTVTVIPTLVDVGIKANVTADSKTGIHSYSYSIKNGKESTGCIWSFEVDIKKPEGTIELSKEGLTNAPKGVDFGAPDKTSPPMIPVAFPSVPKKNKLIVWSVGLSVYGTAFWGSDEYIYEIMPGDTLSGLIMTTYGLPGIRDFRIDPKYIAEDEDLMKMFDLSKITEGEGTELLFTFYENISFKGKTIGPTAPPANFVALDFLSYLIDLKHQAAELGWITNPGVEDSLDVKLDQVKVKLQAGNMKTAANQLSAFLNEVSAQGCETYTNCPNGKHLSPEAWGLLYLNGKYLLERL
ncbi:MAG: hypothetical protein HZA13_08275 [Nitrospirae bacterium]|nr:hypothetical protein [Nitrospirota bacterium]